MKMYAVKTNEGKFLKKSRYKSDEFVDNAWEASLFRRRCDATNSMNSYKRRAGVVVRLEVRVKEEV